MYINIFQEDRCPRPPRINNFNAPAVLSYMNTISSMKSENRNFLIITRNFKGEIVPRLYDHRLAVNLDLYASFFRIFKEVHVLLLV